MRKRRREQRQRLRIECDGVSEPRGKLTLQMSGTIFYSPGIPETDRIRNKSIVTIITTMLLSLEGWRMIYQQILNDEDKGQGQDEAS